MKSFWQKISYLGTTDTADPAELTSLVLANRINALGTFIALSSLILMSFFQLNTLIALLVISLLFFIGVMLLMKNNQADAARLLLCIGIPIFIVALSVVSKLVTEVSYFDYRVILLASSPIPCLVFPFSKRRLLFVSLGFYLLMFIFFDELHHLFEADPSAVSSLFGEFTWTSASRWVWTVAFAVISAGLLAMRKTSDKMVALNTQLTEEVNQRNQEQSNRQNDVKKANEYWEEKMNLAIAELRNANTELIKNNNELQQFSFTVSHNLRGPVASLLGLMVLAKDTEPELMKSPLMAHFSKAAKSLDSTIKDLGRIVDIRNDIFKIKQRVEIEKIVGEIVENLQKEIDQKKVDISMDLQVSEVYVIKPMLVSILYNLISNAIKYTSPQRNGKIKISTASDGDFVFMKVYDNGLGIDLKSQSDKIFKLYKRFHFHTEGKGMGLYLVKMQAELLGGHVTVDSKVDQYTEFTITLPNPKNVNHQLLLETDYGEVFFDAVMDIMGIRWRRAVNSEEYRSVLHRALDFMNDYKAVNWLVDLSKRGPVSPEDQNWVLNHVFPNAFKMGLKRLAVVTESDVTPTVIQFLEKNIPVLDRHGIKVMFFKTVYESEFWLAQEKIVLNETT